MEKIKQMIDRLCPNGIEYSKLGDVCDIKTGKGITKKDAELKKIITDMKNIFKSIIN